MDEKDGEVAHDPGTLPITPGLTSLGFCQDFRYELAIRNPQDI